MAVLLDDLPRTATHDGTLRRVGIEVECGGVTEARLAEIAAERLGGRVRQTADYVYAVEGSALGDIEVLLDTALRDVVEGRVARLGLDLGRAVIPVEFVTEPIPPAQIPEVDRFCAELARQGAFGTQDGIALGFGVHLNVALPGEAVADILPVLTAFALCEDWLRDRMQLDGSRRLLPFVDPYPARLLDMLCDPAAVQWTVDDLAEAYFKASPTRNHGLDALPILKHLFPERTVAAVPAMAEKSSRPAWHYRLPDCRIDDPDWSIGREWRRWVWVEELAADTGCVDRLKALWREYRAGPLPVARWLSLSSPVLDARRPLP